MIEYSDDAIFEAGYLVERGVRPMALIGHCPATPEEMERAMSRLSQCGVPQCASLSAIPFVVDRGDGTADFGFAQHAWAIYRYSWLLQAQVPPLNQHRIIGLLLGYSGEAIRAHEERLLFAAMGQRRDAKIDTN